MSLSILFIAAPLSFASETNDQVEKEIITKKEIIDKTEQIEKFYKGDIKLQNKLKAKIKNGEELDSNNPKKASLGEVEKIDESTFKITYPDGSYALEGIDLSNTKVYDEEGNLLGNFNDLYPDGTLNFNPIKGTVLPEEPQFSTMDKNTISGGTVTVGSGYRTAKGVKVYHYSYHMTVQFKVDYTLVQSGYDYISRIYGVDIAAYEWDILSEGVFRKKETLEYSAYGGVKFKIKEYADATKTGTAHLYIRVAKDKAWIDIDY